MTRVGSSLSLAIRALPHSVGGAMQLRVPILSIISIQTSYTLWREFRGGEMVFIYDTGGVYKPLASSWTLELFAPLSNLIFLACQLSEIDDHDHDDVKETYRVT